MKFIGNLIWLILGGIVIAIIYYLVGLVMCITIVGIPFGIQLFKLGSYAMWPFGRELVDGPREPGCLSIVTCRRLDRPSSCYYVYTFGCNDGARS